MTDSIPTFISSLVIDLLVAVASLLILSLGLFVVYGLFKVVNMAHGDMVMLGAYVASISQSQGLSFWVGAILAALSSATFALIMDKVCVGKLRERSALATLLATWGFSLVISQGIRLTFGSGGRFVAPPFTSQFELFGGIFSTYQLFLLIVGFLLLGITLFIMHGTHLGLRIRAYVDSSELAELNGIDTRTLFTLSFLTGGALAGLAGALLGPITSINPSVGAGFSVSAFMVVIAGGFGDVLSPFYGSLWVGGLKSFLSSVSTATIATLSTLLIIALILTLRRRDDDPI